jgi:excinuclease UvrABC nuclease subunit
VVDWAKIRTEYIAGGTSYRKLSEKYGVSFNTLKTHACEEQWYKLRQQKDQKATTKALETISDKEAKRTTNIVDVADKLIAKIAEMLDHDASYNTQNLKNLTSALKDLKEIKGFKSAADMREQEARIKNLEKQAMAEDNELSEIHVTFGDGGGDRRWAE